MTKERVVDNVLHNRMIQSIGMAAYTRLISSDVCIVGMAGPAVEMAKNLILTGVRSVVLADTKAVAWDDLSDTYCARPEHIGKNRAACYQPDLAGLNTTVHVTHETWDASTSVDVYARFTAVVVVNQVNASKPSPALPVASMEN